MDANAEMLGVGCEIKWKIVSGKKEKPLFLNVQSTLVSDLTQNSTETIYSPTDNFLNSMKFCTPQWNKEWI